MRIRHLTFFFLSYQLHNHPIPYRKAKNWLHKNYPNYIYGIPRKEDRYNCEHLVPQYFLKKHKIDKRGFSDLHLLSISNAKLNSHRQNFKFDNLQQEEGSIIFLNEYGNPCSSSSFHCKKNNKKRLFEPNDHSKGKIARSIGYFYWNYNSLHSNELLDRKVLRQWNKDFPPTLSEIEKNNKVLKRQGNKNIFVDYSFLISICFSRPIFFLKQVYDKQKSNP
jgi:endonuclease I